MNDFAKVNVVCMKWGDKFGSWYVNKLYNMVKRNLTIPFRFWCITDNCEGITEEVSIVNLPEFIVHGIGGRYKKLLIFDNDIFKFKNTVLFLDLNTIILDNIDCFFSIPGEFLIIKNWLQSPGNGKFSSAVMRFEPDVYEILWSEFLNARPDRNENNHHGRHWNVHDQGWISCMFPDLATWPKEWVASFKYTCTFMANHKRKEPKEAKMISFHGKPNIHEVNEDWIVKEWR